MRRIVETRINPLEERLRGMSDQEMLGLTEQFRQRLSKGESPNDILPEAFAAVREASRRAINIRHFDVQLIAGQVLYQGKIAEEATGEGKTFSCYPAVYLMALQGMKVHIVTVNDYLVQRDAGLARPVFELLGMTVGFIQAQMDNQARKEAYQCNITYGTNSEFGFDYLRDNTKVSVADQVQGSLDYAIVDEVDNILIDEARTPLILSGPAYGDVTRYRKADGVASRLEQMQSVANRETLARINAWGDDVPSEFATHPKFRESLKKFKADPSQRSGLSLTEDEAVSLGHTQYFVVKAENKNVGMTHAGVTAAQEDRELGAIYQDGAEWPHLITQSLRARVVYQKDRDYVVRDGEVMIVDEFTGRLMEGRQWSEGLHQAVEAKEGVTVKEENQTMATVTLQNYFKLYKKLAGMTGTAMTESSEFMKIYKLEVVSVPTHRPVNRVDYNDRIYRTEEEKYKAIVEEINTYSKIGRPVLVGTTSVEKSEHLSYMLTHTYGVEHQVLNARPENAAREADIVAAAGMQHPLKKDSKQMVGTVTIATNMAGRGTDIKLGSGVVNPACKVPADDQLPPGVKPDALYPAGTTRCCLRCGKFANNDCGECYKPMLDGEIPQKARTDCRAEVPCGLHIIGTERHEARRIDNQLRGRSGRQGDPGSSRFFLSLEDDLMRIFAGPAVLKMLSWLGMEDGMVIENKRISGGLEKAQKRVEQRNFDSRKHLLDYDEVMDFQRNTFYGTRQRVLEGRDLKEIIVDMIEQTITAAVSEYLGGQYGKRSICEWARANLRVDMTPGQIHGESADDIDQIIRDVRTRAKEEALGDITRTIGEYVDPEVESREWDLAGLCSWVMSRYGASISQAQLRRLSPEEMEKAITEAVDQRVDELDLEPIGMFLKEDYASTSLAQWARQKFGLTLTAQELEGAPAEICKRLLAQVANAYRQREIEYPVEFALQQAFPDGDTRNVYHVQALVDWANRKYKAGLTPEDVAEKKIEEVFHRLVDISRQYAESNQLQREVDEHLGRGRDVDAHIQFAAERFDTAMTASDFENADPRERLLTAGDKFLRREINELERFVLLMDYDSAWKDHLLEMDHLKSGIGLRGYAEQDPKIAYKREGSALFGQMLDGVRDSVSENIFKVRLSSTAKMSSVYQINQVVHEQLAGYDHLMQDMEAQQQASQPHKIETIRRAEPKVGRNDPCPCGSGKKYKKCHGKEA